MIKKQHGTAVHRIQATLETERSRSDPLGALLCILTRTKVVVRNHCSNDHVHQRYPDGKKERQSS